MENIGSTRAIERTNDLRDGAPPPVMISDDRFAKRRDIVAQRRQCVKFRRDVIKHFCLDRSSSVQPVADRLGCRYVLAIHRARRDRTENACGALGDLSVGSEQPRCFLAGRNATTQRCQHDLGIPGIEARLRVMLASVARTFHVGLLADCFFDPATALCLKRVTTPDPRQPLTALCEPTRCPNACITARHRPAWERAADDARAHLRERRMSDLQRRALEGELDRLTAVIAGIDPPAP